jgi:dipeptidyl aminopeptidase/acylaminoacyl peptidase
MSTIDRLERDLTDWFAAAAAPGAPDLAESILLETAGLPQRPRWSFIPILPRPMGPTLTGSLARLWLAPRLAFVVLVALLLLALASAVWVGSKRPLPAPFGAAANGLVAYERDGDIFVVDPATGARRALATGPETDVYPRWSLDGTQLAFVRASEAGSRLVIVDAAGTLLNVSRGKELVNVDPDGIAWAPDGRHIIVIAGDQRAINLVDVASGATSVLPIGYHALEAYWRPPDGRELLFVGWSADGPALFRYSLADRTATEVPRTRLRVAAGEPDELRPIGWTPDGSRFAYHRPVGDSGRFETHVVEVETGDEVVLDVAYGRISNDGTRIVGIGSSGDGTRLCVAPVAGGPCTPIVGALPLVQPTGWAAFGWAPDDSVIRSVPDRGPPAVLLSPGGGAVQSPPWAAEGADSWQRRAP